MDKQAQPADGAAATAWIDAYLAALPDDQRAALQSLRRTIAGAAPGAVEAISYGIPAFRYRGHALVWYHAAKKHCSFFPTAEPIERLAVELAGYKTAKGTIQFPTAKPLPGDLVVKIVNYRVAQVDAEAARKG